ncbi:MAG: hypothetical protein Q8R82_14625 [Hyphomonadaceae bacterium]|nr:hypothetical protein [Hyphomonadaceae bacterium]
MTGNSAFSRDSDLTGLWSGEYWYGAGSPVPFSAHLIDSLGTITGTTLEPNTFAHPGLTELSADISGARGELSVRFNKVYHPAPGVHRDPIFYTGTVDSNFTMIDGDWRFANGFSGRFVLVRVSRGARAMDVQREVALGVKR